MALLIRATSVLLALEALPKDSHQGEEDIEAGVDSDLAVGPTGEEVEGFEEVLEDPDSVLAVLGGNSLILCTLFR